MNFESLFTSPKGLVGRAQFIPALLVIITAMAFFAFVVSNRTAQFCVLVLLYPAFCLVAQRLQDMKVSAWLLLLPLLLMLANQLIQLNYFSVGDVINNVLLWAAPLVFLSFAVWGCIAESNS